MTLLKAYHAHIYEDESSEPFLVEEADESITLLNDDTSTEKTSFEVSSHLKLLLEFVYYALFGFVFVPLQFYGIYWGLVLLVVLYECSSYLRRRCSQPEEASEGETEDEVFCVLHTGNGEPYELIRVV